MRSVRNMCGILEVATKQKKQIINKIIFTLRELSEWRVQMQRNTLAGNKI